jgi:ribonuclease Y
MIGNLGILLLAATGGFGWIVAAVAIGAGISAAIFVVVVSIKKKAIQAKADQSIDAARREAEEILKKAEIDAKAEHIKRTEEFGSESAQVREELKNLERRLTKREDSLESKLDTLAHKERSLEAAKSEISTREAAAVEKTERLDELIEQEQNRLFQITDLDKEQAKEMLLSRLDEEMTREAGEIIEKRVSEARESADQKAREIIITSIQRSATEHTCDSTVSAVDLPSDDMKGRVIGREGRNIRAFEKATGVDVIVDDTPGVVVVSAFDPVRREVARRSMIKLLSDGRIHPARIEETIETTQKELDRDIIEIGKKAAMDLDVRSLHERLTTMLGRLHFRTSYGQNVLRHSIEVALLCEMMADQLKLDGRLARRCGLLHDIGKAADHEMEGGHPKIGHDICKRHNERPEILNACLAHHGDAEITSVYTTLVSAADAISASRPGARRESLERYIRRLEDLEALAVAANGVKQAYAIQAGREIRVIVDPERIDDKSSWKVARDIAKRIEEEMTYPGEVKVTVLRETRAIEYAR